jgi:hypothetical protein
LAACAAGLRVLLRQKVASAAVNLSKGRAYGGGGLNMLSLPSHTPQKAHGRHQFKDHAVSGKAAQRLIFSLKVGQYSTDPHAWLHNF